MYTSRAVYEYISLQTKDPIVEWKLCAVSGTEFPIYKSDVDFYTKISSSKFLIPTPTLCSEERQRRRLSFRNERKLYRRTCDFSGKEIISMYSPDKTIKVYDLAIWWSDVWDAKTYGREFDFSRNFMDQFSELVQTVPRFNLSNDNQSENSAYVNETTYQKNCYYTFDADQDEDCMYGNSIKFSKKCIDTSNVYYCEQSYELVNCTKCFDCTYCTECETSQFLISCSRCKDCSYCFESENLSNKKYYFRNQACHSREEYLEKLSSATIQGYIVGNSIKRGCYTIQDQGSFGNNLAYTKDCIFAYNFGNCQNIKYSTCLNDSKNSMDFDIWGIHCEYIYEGITVGENAYNMLFNVMCWGNTKNLLYCYHCFACSDCFGCMGLKNQQYCIFNKQYSKEEYEKEVAKIIAHMVETGEWGEFFHPSLSPFGYNETLAMEYYPVVQTPSASPYPPYQGEKIEFGVTTGKSMLPPGQGRGTACGGGFDELKKFGYHRSDYSSDPKIPENISIIDPKFSSDEQWKSLLSNPEITKKIFVCMESGRPYRVLKQELDCYQKHSLELPKFHPDVRHAKRMALRPERSLSMSICDCCGKEILSVYNKEASIQKQETSKIYCETCYNREVFA